MSAKSRNRVPARTNHKSVFVDCECESAFHWGYRFKMWICRGASVLLCDSQFLIYMCNVNYSIFLLRISFYIYACPGVFHATVKDSKLAWECFGSVTVVFIPLWKLSFLRMCWMNTFCYAYHFIHKCCVFHMYITIAGFNGQWLPSVLRCTVNVTAQGRKTDTFQISKESSTVCS